MLAYHSGSFTHLHVHSSYSDGLASPLQLARRAAQLGFTALALTDHSTLDGHAAFINACAIYHLTPILGVELRVHSPEGAGHMVILARHAGEYDYLSWLVRRKKKVELGQLRGAGIVTSGCRGGVIAQSLQQHNYWRASDHAARASATLESRYYLELQPNFTNLIPWVIQLAYEQSIPTLVTNDVHYVLPEDRFRHINSDHWLMSDHEIRLRNPHKQYLRGCDETMRVVRACQDYPKLAA